jgi:hypothetical protein
MTGRLCTDHKMSIGFDKHSINQGLLLAMTMDEYTGVASSPTYDRAKPHHPFHLTGCTWGALVSGLPYLLFNGAADFVECHAADSVDLNFTAGNISIVVWIYDHVSGGSQEIINQGVVNIDGWQFFTFGTNLSFRLNQGGGHTDISAVAAYAANTWSCVGVTRTGNTGQFYVNGVSVTTIGGGSLVNAVSCAGGNKLLLGVKDTEAGDFWDGMIAGGHCAPRIWNRELTAIEIARIFAMERHWFSI